MKIIKIQLLVTSLIYLCIYLIVTFVIWDFRNPFQWIIDIPKYDCGERGLILFYYLLYQISSFILIYSNIKLKAK